MRGGGRVDSAAADGYLYHGSAACEGGEWGFSHNSLPLRHTPTLGRPPRPSRRALSHTPPPPLFLLGTRPAPSPPFLPSYPLPFQVTMLRSALLVVAAATVAVAAATGHEDPNERPDGFDLAVQVTDVQLTVLNTTASPESAAEAKILIEEGCLPEGGPAVRRLLKFSTTIRNEGDEDLFIGLPPHDRSRKTPKWEVRRGAAVWHCWMGWWGRGVEGGGLRERFLTWGGFHRGRSFTGVAADFCISLLVVLVFLACLPPSVGVYPAVAHTVGHVARALALPQLCRLYPRSS